MPSARTRLAAAVGVAVFGGADAAAQDIRISVTGTNIKRADTETAAPIETITREDILASGLQTISDVVRQITANNNGSISPSLRTDSQRPVPRCRCAGCGPTTRSSCSTAVGSRVSASPTTSTRRTWTCSRSHSTRSSASRC